MRDTTQLWAEEMLVREKTECMTSVWGASQTQRCARAQVYLKRSLTSAAFSQPRRVDNVEIVARRELTPTLSRCCPTAAAPSFNNETVRVAPTNLDGPMTGSDPLSKARTNGVIFADDLLHAEN